MILRGRVLLCPLPRSRYCCLCRFDQEVEGIILRGLVLLCLPPLSSNCSIFPFDVKNGGYGPTGPGTVFPPPAHAMLLFSPALTRFKRV